MKVQALALSMLLAFGTFVSAQTTQKKQGTDNNQASNVWNNECKDGQKLVDCIGHKPKPQKQKNPPPPAKTPEDETKTLLEQAKEQLEQAKDSETETLFKEFECRKETALGCANRFFKTVDSIKENNARLLSICKGKTVINCFSTLFDAANSADGATSDQAKDKVTQQAGRQGTAATNAKMTASTDPGSASATSDNISSFIAALGLDGVNESDGNINLDFNPVVLGKGKARLSFGITLQDKMVFAPLLEAIPESLREERQESLEEEIGDFDMADYRVKLSFEGKLGKNSYLGRTFTKYKPIYESWYEEIIDMSASAEETERREAYLVWLQMNRITPGQKIATIADLSKQRKLLNHIEDATTELATVQNRVVTTTDNTASLLADLVNNQPQMSITYTRKERDGPSGPPEDVFVFSYEIGTLNVNSFLRWAKRHKEGTPKDGLRATSADCGEKNLICFESYRSAIGGDYKLTGAKDVSTKIKKSPKFSLELSYSKTDMFSFMVPLEGNNTLDFNVGEIEKWVGTAKFGKVLRLNDEGEDQARFDLEAAFEDPTDIDMETMQQLMGEIAPRNRFVVTATYTEKLPGNLEASFSAVYADEPIFLGDVNEKLRANFGIKWKFSKAAEGTNDP